MAAFCFDFSPESVIFRLTDDPAPRILYVFEQNGQTIDAPALQARVEAEDIDASELVIGGELRYDRDSKGTEENGGRCLSRSA